MYLLALEIWHKGSWIQLTESPVIDSPDWHQKDIWATCRFCISYHLGCLGLDNWRSPQQAIKMSAYVWLAGWAVNLSRSSSLVVCDCCVALCQRCALQVVGILMRARRQGFVSFEGEMLFQRRDDHVIIRLIKSPDELEADVEKLRGELRVHPSKRN